jgi:hypothetical protein
MDGTTKQTGARLNAGEIYKTIERLHGRISDRFPRSGLSGVCQHLADLSRQTDQVLEWISRPNYVLRILIGVVLVLLAVTAVYSVCRLNLNTDGLNVVDFVQMIEAVLNEVLLLAAGITFLVTLETRRKRKRVIQAVNRLRTIAHLIDAHQLTKDPDMIIQTTPPTTHSPARELREFEMGRYLEYCSEMLSLTGKVGFLYVQDFDDPAANSAVNDLEDLTTELSQKILQKIIILRGIRVG